MGRFVAFAGGDEAARMNTVVYYPYLHPTTEELKLFALYWDRVYRIQPPDAPDDPEPIVELNSSLGGVLEPVATEAVAAQVAEAFVSWVDAQPARSSTILPPPSEHSPIALFRGKFPETEFIQQLEQRGVARIESRPEEVLVAEWEKDTCFAERYTEAVVRPVEPEQGSAHEQYEQLHKSAMDELLAGHHQQWEALEAEAERLRSQHLTTVRDSVQAVYLPKDVALHYLSLCAAHAARNDNRDLIAGEERFTDAVFHEVRALRGSVATGVLEARLPTNLSNVEPARIRDLRADLATQRLQFEQAVQSVVDDFAAVASEDELGHMKKRIVDIANDRISQTEQAYRRSRLKSVVRSLGLSVAPTALARSVGSILGVGIFTPAAVASAIAAFAAGFLLEREESDTDRAQSPWSYVLHVAQRLK